MLSFYTRAVFEGIPRLEKRIRIDAAARKVGSGNIQSVL